MTGGDTNHYTTEDCTCFVCCIKRIIYNSVRPEVLTEDEICEDIDMDTGEEGTRDASSRTHQTVDSGLTTSARMDAYHSAHWRVEVCACLIVQVQ